MSQEQQSDQEDDCFGHDYEFLEKIPTEQGLQQLWYCINCGHENLRGD
jgi:hypothetical protein